jgi:hypothetical protein
VQLQMTGMKFVTVCKPHQRQTALAARSGFESLPTLTRSISAHGSMDDTHSVRIQLISTKNCSRVLLLVVERRRVSLKTTCTFRFCPHPMVYVQLVMFRFRYVTGGGPTRSMSVRPVFSRAGLLAALQSYLARTFARVKKTRRDKQTLLSIPRKRTASTTDCCIPERSTRTDRWSGSTRYCAEAVTQKLFDTIHAISYIIFRTQGWHA